MKLNFKEHLADFAIDTAKDFIIDATSKDTTVEKASITFKPEVSEEAWAYQEEPIVVNTSAIVEAKANSKKLLNTVEAKNIFSLPSVLTVGFFLLSTIFVDIDQALVDNTFTPREYFKVFYLLFGGVVTLIARGSEGRTGVYTPHGLPGLNKEDFIDDNNDGIDDRHQ